MAVAGLGPIGSTKQRLCQSLSRDGEGVTAWPGAAVPPLCPRLLGMPPPKLQQGLWAQAPSGSQPPFPAPVSLGAQGPVPSWVLAPARPSATKPLPHSAPLPIPRHPQGCAQPLARALHARLLPPQWALAVGVHRVPAGTAGPVSYSKPSTRTGRRAAAWASGGCHCCKAPWCWSTLIADKAGCPQCQSPVCPPRQELARCRAPVAAPTCSSPAHPSVRPHRAAPRASTERAPAAGAGPWPWRGPVQRKVPKASRDVFTPENT